MTEPNTDTRVAAVDRTADADTSAPVSADSHNRFVAGLELAGIDVVRLTGERRASGHAPQTRFDLAAGWQVDNGTVLWRYDVVAHLTDSEGTDYGSVEVSVVLTGRTPDEPDGACIEQFGGTSGALIAHPYLRETIATTALRLGFTGVLLPMIKHQPDDDSDDAAADGEVVETTDDANGGS